jgi:formiminotetrahydrofolate cyclodeaminase
MTSIEQFVSDLASKEPVPGGGGASAVVAAIGTALGNMVGSLTIGKKKYADVQDDIIRLKTQADVLQADFLALATKDAEVFGPLSRAYGLPNGTDDEKAHKAQVMEAALRAACGVPLEIMQKCGEAIRLLEQFAEKGSAIAISDAGVGAACCLAALKGVSLNVYINTKAMSDRVYAAEINKKTAALLAEYTKLAETVYRSVEERCL